MEHTPLARMPRFPCEQSACPTPSSSKCVHSSGTCSIAHARASVTWFAAPAAASPAAATPDTHCTARPASARWNRRGVSLPQLDWRSPRHPEHRCVAVPLAVPVVVGDVFVDSFPYFPVHVVGPELDYCRVVQQLLQEVLMVP